MLKKLLLLSFLAGFLNIICASQIDSSGITGIWQGKLAISGFELNIVFNVSETDGNLTTTLDSPDQNAYGIKVDSTSFKNDSVYFGISAIKGFFYGIYHIDSINGTWHQGGNQWSLILKKTEKVEKPKRPQVPEKPYPYNEEEVSFPDKEAGVELAGTLTIPKEGGPFPAVVLVTGSGPQDRNESLLGHEPFLILADYLTRQGIAVLRYDDRGVGKSTGKFSTATTKDFVNDALAAVNFLKNRKDISKNEIGIIGHSEGGLIAPLAAVESNDVNFIVLMAGPGVTGKAILLEQSELIEKAMGMSADKIEKGTELAKKFYEIVENEKDSAAASEKIIALYKEYYASLDSADKAEFGNDPESVFDRQAQTLLSPWFKFFLTYDPKGTLEKVKVPVLAINGENDLQVPPKQNLPAIEEALKEGGNKDYKVVEIPKLNHLFQTSETGSPTEYSKIEETISPKALKIIGTWILEHTKK
jgi:pimeloyl-ACP methyl ester carboxylesterase